MVTVINNPGSGDSTESSSGFMLGVIIVVLLVVLFIIFGLPALRNPTPDAATETGDTDINVSVPAPQVPSNNNENTSQ